MILLNLSHFVEIVRRFETQADDENYFWDTQDNLGNYLAKPIQQSCAKELDSFLRSWQSARRNIRWVEFENFWTPEVQNIASLCSGHSLENSDLGEEIGLPNHNLTIGQAIEILFARLRMVEGIGATNASKLLALSMPRLFVMWDYENIRSLYKLRSSPRGYRDYLSNAQAYVKKLLAAVSEEQSLTTQEAVHWLENLPTNQNWSSVVSKVKPIAKLVDEYHYSLPAYLDQKGFLGSEHLSPQDFI